MGFSIKLAPGVRIRASSRGVRTSLGPRVARVHLGGGRTGISSGIGPLTYYTSVGGNRVRVPTSSPRRTGSATANRQLAAERAAGARAEKAAEGERLKAQFDQIRTIHQAEFPLVQRPVAPSPPTVDRRILLSGHRARAKRGTSVFNRAARNTAYAQAARDPEHEARDIEAVWGEEETAWQRHLDSQWTALLRNDPDMVLHGLAEAFSDNDAAAAAVGISGAALAVVVVVPPPTVLPERKPMVTPAGNLSLKKLTKKESSELYKTLVCGHILVTIKEAFASAPSVTTIISVAVRPATIDSSAKITAEVLVAAEFKRSRLQDLRWDETTSIQAFDDVADHKIMITRGASRELIPIDLDKEPYLADFSEVIDFDDLLGG